MTIARIRKIITVVDEIHHEMGRQINHPTRKAAAIAVIENPFASQYIEDLDILVRIGEELGTILGKRCIKALGIEPSAAKSYGKAALIGENGELEHGAAILHPRMGAPLRVEVEGGAALIPLSLIHI